MSEQLIVLLVFAAIILVALFVVVMVALYQRHRDRERLRLQQERERLEADPWVKLNAAMVRASKAFAEAYTPGVIAMAEAMERVNETHESLRRESGKTPHDPRTPQHGQHVRRG